MSREITKHDYQNTPPPEVVVTYLCFDGLLGCGEQKPISEYRLQTGGHREQPDICDRCLRQMSVEYGVPLSEIDMLVLIRHQELRLITQAIEANKDRDISGPLAVLKAGQEERYRGYVKKIFEASRMTGGVEKVISARAAYVKWWWMQIGTDYTPMQGGIQTISGAAVPVGDR